MGNILSVIRERKATAVVDVSGGASGAPVKHFAMANICHSVIENTQSNDRKGLISKNDLSLHLSYGKQLPKLTSEPNSPPVPCLICENPGLWESIYRDGIFRCPECDPWPARAFVGGFWMLVLDSENSDRPAGYRWEAIFAGASETVYDDRRDSHPLAVHPAAVTTTLVDLPGQPCPYCRRSTKFRDTKIHNGLAVRRDCAACKKFVGFPVWDGSG